MKNESTGVVHCHSTIKDDLKIQSLLIVGNVSKNVAVKEIDYTPSVLLPVEEMSEQNGRYPVRGKEARHGH